MDKYEKSGSAGSKGIHFQINLLMMFLLKALDSGLNNWRLSSENKHAGKFDDVVLEMPDRTIMLQAKYKEKKGKRVTFTELLSTNSKQDDFSLPKYFLSYQTIKTKFPVESIIICTNADIDEKALQYLNVHDTHFESILHYMGSRCSIYKLNDNILPCLKEYINKYYEINLSTKNFTVNDEEIKDFLQQLDIYFNYPSERDLERVVKQLLSPTKYYNLCCQISLTELYEKVKIWFELPPGRCYYLTKIQTKAIFCEIKSENYCETLDRFKVFFQTDEDLLLDGSKNIYHIVTDGRYLLHVIKIYRILQKKQLKILYVNPEDSIEVQQEILEAFELPGYKFLILTWPSNIEGTLTNKASRKLIHILEKYDYKSVIFIGEDNNKLLQQIKLNNDDCSVIKKDIIFEDLAKDTQKMLLSRRIIFQGNSISLGELLSIHSDDDYETVFCSEILDKLIRGEGITVGVEVPFLVEGIAQYYIHRKFYRIAQNSLSSEECFPENKIFNLDEKVALIVDSAGTGKSTVLANLGITIKKNHPHLWVIRIELNNYTEILNELLEKNENSLDIVQLLNSKKATKLESFLEQFLFSKSKKVVLMLDGVDEISPDYTTLILEMLSKCLKMPNFVKIFITSRPHVTKQLVEQLQVYPFNLQPLEKHDQVHFLKSYWENNLKLQDEDINRCEVYAKVLINKISSWLPRKIFSKENVDILAIPLLLRMVGEIFMDNTQSDEVEWEGCKEFVTSYETQPKLPKKMNITDLYKLFIEKKQKIFLEKENPSGHATAKRALKDKFDECLACHRTLALKLFLHKTEYDTFTRSLRHYKHLKPFLMRIGIIHELQEKYYFVHRTFAEYFLAESFVKELQLPNENIEFQQFFINDILSLGIFNITRVFIDSFLRITLDSIPCTALENYENFASESQDHNSTLIHRVAKEGFVGILQLIFKCVNFRPCLCGGSSDTLTSSLKSSSRLTSASNVLAVIKHVVGLNGVNIKDNIYGKTPLHYATRNGHLGMVKFLIENKACVNISDKYGYTPLWDTYDLDIIRYLSEQGIDVNKRSLSGRTALHYAAITALDLTEQPNKLPALKCLIECGGDVNVKDNDGCTPLHLANSLGSLKTVECLVERGADINSKEKKGRTALHLAALSGLLSSIQCLVQWGADINSKDINGRTALHLVASLNQLKRFNTLVACGADVNVRDDQGCTPLHLAASSDQLENVKFLVECGANVSIRNTSGRTARDMAIFQLCPWDVVEVLAKRETNKD